MTSPATGRMAARQRIDAIDLARGFALLAMAVFHFAWDLEFFGLAEPGMTQQFGWRLFARAIAATFLALVGISLFLAHRHGIGWPAFRKRLAQIAGAALLITLATWYATPERFIFFGILHQIALASLIGLAFLRLPAGLLLLLAAAIFAAPHFLRTPLLNHPALWWIGLAPLDPVSNDYVPLFPWFGAVLTGIAAARIADAAGLFARLASVRAGNWAGPARLAGRHGLAFYLLHQPALIGALWLFTAAFPVAATEAPFEHSCRQSCTEMRDEAYCTVYCGCVLDGIDAAGMLDEVPAAGSDIAVDVAITAIAQACQQQQQGGPTQ